MSSDESKLRPRRYKVLLNGTSFMGMALCHEIHHGFEFAPDSYGEFVQIGDVRALEAEVLRLNNVDHNADLWCKEPAALRKDAERYRFLRSCVDEGRVVYTGCQCTQYKFTIDGEHKSLDDAVDAGLLNIGNLPIKPLAEQTTPTQGIE